MVKQHLLGKRYLPYLIISLVIHFTHMLETFEAPGSWAVPPIEPDYKNFNDKEIEHGVQAMMEVEAHVGDIGSGLGVELLRLDDATQGMVEAWGEQSTEKVINSLAGLIRCAMRTLETSVEQDNVNFVPKTRLTLARAVHVQRQILQHAVKLYPKVAEDIARMRYDYFVEEGAKLLE